MEEITKGELIIRVDFNPSNKDIVFQIKQKAAELINLVNDLEAHELDSSKRRLKATAITEIEGAAMWAVKAATA
tara:strand:- start:2691 stop:2912 length:222 start_codon:yes stop_codon:yes gene_type:complete